MRQDEELPKTRDKENKMSFTNKIKKKLISVFPFIYKNYTIATYLDGKKIITKLNKLKYKDNGELGKIVHLLINERNANFYTNEENSDSFKHFYKELKTIEFGDYVKNITGSMFYQPKLEIIIFGKSVEKIGADNNGVFKGNYELKWLDFSKANKLRVIGNKAFQRCAVEKLVFPNSLEEIGEYAFNNNGVKIWMTGGIIKMPDNLKSIGEYAFNNTDLEGVLFSDGSFYGNPNEYLKNTKCEIKKSDTHHIPLIRGTSFNIESNYAWFVTDNFFKTNKDTLLGQKICKVEQPEIAEKLKKLRRHFRLNGILRQSELIEDEGIKLKLDPVFFNQKEANAKSKKNTPTNSEIEF